jgi:hypothetical protein
MTNNEHAYFTKRSMQILNRTLLKSTEKSFFLYLQFIPQGHKSRLSRQAAQLSFIPQGHKFRLSRQAAQLSFIPQGHKFRLSRQAAQLSFIFSTAIDHSSIMHYFLSL